MTRMTSNLKKTQLLQQKLQRKGRLLQVQRLNYACPWCSVPGLVGHVIHPLELALPTADDTRWL